MLGKPPSYWGNRATEVAHNFQRTQVHYPLKLTDAMCIANIDFLSPLPVFHER